MTTLRTIINDTSTNTNVYKTNIPVGDLVDESTGQTLTNKTLDGGSNTFTNIGVGSITGLPTFPTGDVVGTTDSQILYSKELDDDSTFFTNNTDPTKRLRVSCSLLPAGVDSIWTFPNSSGSTFVGINTTQTLGNKTLTGSSTSFGDNLAPTKLFKFECTGLTAGATKTYTAPDQSGTMIVSNITNRVHNSVPSWNSTTSEYEDNQDAWVDLPGDFSVRSGGGANPFVLTQFDIAGRIWDYATANSGGQISQGYTQYHIPHDYKPNTDMFFHLHLSTNKSVNTTCAFLIYATFAKANQIVPVDTLLQTLTYTFQGASDLRKINVVEIPLTTAGGSATTLDTSLIETDGIVHITVFYQRGFNGDNMANNTPTFIHFADIHYKSTSRGTKNKVSPFNT